MAENTENLTIKLLQEMRKEMRTESKELRSEMNMRFDNMDKRMDGLTQIVTLLASYTHGIEERVEKLEFKK